MSGTVGVHNELHSEHGARPGEHRGRARNPVIKVADIAWLEFEKPDLDRAEAFARAFGFTTVLRTPDELQLRGTDAGAPCVLLRREARSRFVGTAFRAADDADVLLLADVTGAPAKPLPPKAAPGNGSRGLLRRPPRHCSTPPTSFVSG